MIIDIFCEVIDNYGDIAVVYRLIKSVLNKQPHWRIRVVIDELGPFSALCPAVSLDLPYQRVSTPAGDEFEVFHSRKLDYVALCQNGPADLVIQAFGCELPVEYIERLNMEPPSLVLQYRLIILLEYLTAEQWAETTHLLPSPIPQQGLRKYFFVPSFRDKAGGILLDEEFLQNRKNTLRLPGDVGQLDAEARLQRQAFCAQWIPEHVVDIQSRWVSIFTYEHNFNQLITDLKNSDQAWTCLVPQGRSSESFWRDWSLLAKNSKMSAIELSFLPQESYDALVQICDLNIVRGEESWVRAVLSGRPYLWHAYLQEEGYQIHKVEAFLEVWQPHFFQSIEKIVSKERAAAVWTQLSASFIDFNTRSENDGLKVSAESYQVFLQASQEIEVACQEFASYLIKNADLTAKLLEFIQGFRI